MIRRTVLLTMCVVFVAAAPTEAFDINLAVGADFGGDFDLGNVSLSSNTGYNLGLEIAFEVPFIELGAGLEYGFSREASATDLKASYYQIYGIGRFFFGPVYIAGRFGYANMSVSTILEGDFGASGSWARGWSTRGGRFSIAVRPRGSRSSTHGPSKATVTWHGSVTRLPARATSTATDTMMSSWARRIIPGPKRDAPTFSTVRASA